MRSDSTNATSSAISFTSFKGGQSFVEWLPDTGKAPNVSDTSALPIVYLAPIQPAALPELRWAIDGFVTAPGVTLVSGVAKSGKSHFVTRMAIALAAGVPFLECFPATGGNRVLYVVGEDWLPNVYRRIGQHAADMGVSKEDLHQNVLPYLNVVPVCGLRLDQREQFVLLRDALDAFKYDVVILDPLARFHQLDEDKATGMAPLLRAFREIGDSRVLIVVHHEGKRSEGAGYSGGSSLGHRARGTSAFADVHDNYIALAKTKRGFRVEREHKYQATPDPIEVSVEWPRGGDPHWEVLPSETFANLPQRVLAFVRVHAGCTTGAVKDAVTGRADSIVRVLGELEAGGQLVSESSGQSKYWRVAD